MRHIKPEPVEETIVWENGDVVSHVDGYVEFWVREQGSWFYYHGKGRAGDSTRRDDTMTQEFKAGHMHFVGNVAKGGN